MCVGGGECHSYFSSWQESAGPLHLKWFPAISCTRQFLDEQLLEVKKTNREAQGQVKARDNKKDMDLIRLFSFRPVLSS